jgi:ATPase subunit of ABC transporter with duplicated ATPase domains
MEIILVILGIFVVIFIFSTFSRKKNRELNNLKDKIYSLKEENKELKKQNVIQTYKANENSDIKKEKSITKILDDNKLPTNFNFTEDFKKAFDLMEQTNYSIFVTGKAGTGKSTLIEYFRLNTKKKVIYLAPTGVAALNIKGKTIHSLFKFPPQVVTSDQIKDNTF